MTTYFEKYGMPHVAIITEEKYNFKCIGYDITYRTFKTYSEAYSFMKQQGYKVRS